jgi:hypothetical protein
MLKIKDKNGKVKFVWKDEDEQPISIEEVVIKTTPKSDKDQSKKENSEEK